MRSPGWYRRNTSTDSITILNFHLASVTRTHQATRGNENTGTVGDCQQRLSRLSVYCDIIWQKLNQNTHTDFGFWILDNGIVKTCGKGF